MDVEEAGSVHGWARLRRPAGLVEQTRWNLWLAVLFGLLLLGPWPFTSLSPASGTAAGVAAGSLIACWAYRYLSRSSPLPLDMGEVAATALLATACPSPAMVLGVALLALWFRSLYGSNQRVVLFSLLLSAGIAASMLLWGLLPGRDGPGSPTAVLASIPVMLLTMAVARHLALGLFTRSQSRQRDAALLRLGHELIGATDKATIYQRSRTAAAAICRATPEMRALFLHGDGDVQLVAGQVGPFRRTLRSLPRAVFPVAADRQVGPWPMVDPRLLDDASGVRCEWLALSLPEEPDAWILLGAPRRVSPEALAAVQSMINQAALALRTSAAHRDLAAQARQDALTGLPNRAAFTSALEFAIADPARQLALLFLDLDDFKVVNDRLGHAAGDELLRVVATRLTGSTRPDDLCARLGGDEFAVLLQDAADTAAGVAQRLVGSIGGPISLADRITHVGASVGLAYATADTSAERLVQQADIAMYAAKAKGKNRVQVFETSLLLDDGKETFDAELDGAAAAGQLVVHYQPIISVADGSCVAVEALVRWQHPTRGLLGPIEFIPAAERTGSIIGIGAFVLRQACADSAGWRGPAGRLAVHVNVSAAQLTHPAFQDEVRSCMGEFGMAPQQLVLEITESMVLDSPAIRVALDRLTEIGAAIAIDDFGTGYSALSTLRALPLDIVKLDKSFISGGRSHATDEAVVGAIVQMAGRLGLRIVAEGVERVDQQRFLEEVGADAAQGYLHLRPTPALEFATWLRQRRSVAPAKGAGTVTPLEPRRSG
ncbi:MAG TPA: bifunctional diguanylate cyclase/phosphodiesterase [Pseudonocardia sp.]|nr:bifunctional diguanylate cyclase/phosphodiesterase [Pseudonocardia sp.]